MATGLPVIATATGGNPEVVVNGDSGLLFPVGNFRQLADQLLVLQAGRDLRIKLGQQALRRARKDFSIEICYPRIGGSHVNRHKQLLRKLPEQLLIGQRKRVAPIRGDVEDRLCLRRHGDHDRGRDDDERRTFDLAPERNAGWQPDRGERQKAPDSNQHA